MPLIPKQASIPSALLFLAAVLASSGLGPGLAAAGPGHDPGMESVEAESGEDPPRAFQGQNDAVYPEFPDSAPDAPEARLRMVFDLVSGAQELAVEAKEPFDVYVVAYDVQVALMAWEAHFVVDPRLYVLEREIPSEIIVGQGNEVSVTMKPRDCMSGTPLVLARLKLMFLEEGLTDLVVGLGPITRPSIPTVATDIEGPMPVYLVCRPDPDLRPFDFCNPCVVVNPRTVQPERDESARDGLRELLAPQRARG